MNEWTVLDWSHLSVAWRVRCVRSLERSHKWSLATWCVRLKYVKIFKIVCQENNLRIITVLMLAPYAPGV